MDLIGLPRRVQYSLTLQNTRRQRNVSFCNSVEVGLLQREKPDGGPSAKRVFAAPHLNAAYAAMTEPGFDQRTDAVLPGDSGKGGVVQRGGGTFHDGGSTSERSVSSRDRNG